MVKIRFFDLKAANLVDTGIRFIDPQDPALRLTIGQKVFTTDRQVDKVSNASFPESFEFDISENDYNNGLQLEVEGLNMNGDGTVKHKLGKSEIPIKANIPANGQNTTIVVNLIYKGKPNQGKVTMTAVMEPFPKQPEKTAEPAKPVEKAVEKPTVSVVQPAAQPPKTEQPVKASEVPNQARPEPATTKTDDNTSTKKSAEATKPATSASTGDSGRELKLKIFNIRAEDLVDTGSFIDGQDPAVLLSCLGEKFTTERKKDAGIAAKFDEKFEMKLFESDFNNGAELKCTVLNLDAKNATKSEVGHGKVSLKSVIGINESKDIVIELVNKTKGKKGRVILTLMLATQENNAEMMPNKPTAADPTSQPELEPTKTSKSEPTGDSGRELKLKIFNIRAEDLVDTGSFIDGQDPAVLLSCLEEKFTTERKKDAGTKGALDENFERKLSEPGFTSGVELDCKVLNLDAKNKTKNEIGNGKVSLQSVISINESKDVVISLGKKGRVLLTLMLATQQNNADAETAKSSKKESGKESTELAGDTLLHVKLTNLEASELVDTVGAFMSAFDAQDPALRVLLGSQERHTKRQVDAKTQASFPETFEFDITKEEYDAGIELTAEVNNLSNTNAVQAQIGIIKALLKSLVPTLDKPTTFVLKLNHFPKNKKQPIMQGKVAMTGVITVKGNRSSIAAVNKPTDKAADDIHAKARKSPDQFQAGELHVTKIVCKDLKNVEYGFDGNDPFATVKFGTKEFTTETHENAGANTEFDYLDFKFDVDKTAMLYDKMHIIVNDRNNLRPNVIIGEVMFPVKSALEKMNDEVELSLPLSSEHWKNPGKVVVYLKLVDQEVIQRMDSLTHEVDKTFTEGVMQVDVIRGFDIHSSNWFSGFQIYCKLKMGTWQHQTQTINVDKTGTPVFDRLELETYVNRDTLTASQMTVEVWNDGITDKLLGRGEVSIKPLGVAVNEFVDLHVDLTDHGVSTGHLLIRGKAIPRAKVVDVKDMTVDPAFEKGYFHIKAITAHDLANTEWTGKQDPYVKFEFGDEWSDRVKTLDEQGAEAYWSDLTLKCPVTRSDIESHELQVLVYDENTSRPDVLIGKASVLLKSAATKLRTETPIKFDIFNAANKKTGRITLDVAVYKELDNLQVPNSFKTGYVRINKLIGRSIKHGNFLSAPKLKLILLHGPNEAMLETSVVAEIDDEFTWDHQDFKLPVTKDSLASDNLKFQLKQGNKVLATGKLDHLLLCGSQIEQEVEMDLHLYKNNPDYTSSDPKNSVGQIVFLATVFPGDIPAPIDLSIDTSKEKMEALKAKFKPFQAVLLINRIDGTHLRNTEMLAFLGDKQDPYIEIELGDWRKRTEVLNGASGDVIWKDLNYRANINSHELFEKDLVVRAYDKNYHSKDALIGESTFNLADILASRDQEKDYLIELKQANGGKPAGTVKISAMIFERKLDKDAEEFQKTFKDGLLHIFRIVANDLANLEWGIMGTQQDPYIKLKLNDVETRTPTHDNAGSDTVFEDLDIKIPVTADTLLNSKLEIEAWEANTTGDLLIGSTRTDLLQINKMNHEFDFFLEVMDKKKNLAGKLQVFAKLIEKPATEADLDKVEMSPDLDLGTCTVRKIRAFGLKNTEQFAFAGAHQTPYVCLKFAEIFEGKSPMKMHGGTDCEWDLLDLKFDVRKEAVQKYRMEAEVKVKSKIAGADQTIGVANCSLKRAGVELGQVVEIIMELKDPKKPDAVAGKLILDVELKPSEANMKYEMPKDFEFGVLTISRIDAFHLKNTEFAGKQDPYIVLKLDSWTEKTYTKDEAGDDASWEHLNFSTDVYRNMIEPPKMLEVEVYDENTTRADVLIGKNELSLVKGVNFLNKEVEYTIEILDEKEVVTGKVRIFATITQPEVNNELPEDFLKGNLHIKRISANNLKNSEWFGLSKGDPYVVVKVDAFKGATKPQSNQDNVLWNYLDIQTEIEKKTAKVGTIYLELWDKNSAVSGDKHLGTAEIPVAKLSTKLTKDVEISNDFKNKDGKVVGRATMLGCITPMFDVPIEKMNLPEGFEMGVIEVKKIRAFGLTNVELVGKQDPYVQLTIDDYSETTSTMQDKGSDVTWEGLDMEFEVTKSMLEMHKLNVQVFDENYSRDDVLIGNGDVKFRKFCDRINNMVEVTVELSNEKGTKTGMCSIVGVLKPLAAEKAEEVVPESAVKLASGKLKIKQIDVIDLKGGENSVLGGKKDPHVELALADWTAATVPQTKTSRNIHYKDLTFETVVPEDIIKFKNLEFVVKDASKRELGHGILSLRKLGSQPGIEMIHKIRLKEKVRGRKVGKLEVVAVIEALQTLEEKKKLKEAGIDPNNPYPFKKGKFLLNLCEIQGLRNESMMHFQQTAYLDFSLGSWRKTSEATKTKDNNATFELKTKSDPLSVLLLKKTGLYIAVKRQAKSKPDISDVILGDAVLTNDLDLLLMAPSKWKKLTVNLHHDHDSAGTMELNAKFVPEGEMDETFDDNGNEAINKLMDTMHNQRDDFDKKFGEMANDIREALKKELAEDRQSLIKAMKDTQGDIGAFLQTLNKTLMMQKKNIITEKSSMPLQSDVHNLKLPANIKTWRTAHVRAWVAFQMELPEYMENFQKCSVDGPVLLGHVDYEILTNDLNVPDEMHKQKFLYGIKVLQLQQEQLEKELELENMKKLKKQKEEISLLQKRMAEMEKKKEKKSKKSTKKKKKKLNLSAPNANGQVIEQNVIERVKVANSLKKHRDEQKRLKSQADATSDTWQFEYTGAMKPKFQSIWETDPFEKKVGTQTYQKVMATDVLTSKDFTSKFTPGQALKPPNATKLRTIPRNCFPDEVLSIVKGAMFDVSNWLMEIEKTKLGKEATLNNDLEDLDDQQIWDGNASQTASIITAPTYEKLQNDKSFVPIPSAKLSAENSASRNARNEQANTEEEDDDQPVYHNSDKNHEQQQQQQQEPIDAFSGDEEDEEEISLPAYDTVLKSPEFERKLSKRNNKFIDEIRKSKTNNDTSPNKFSTTGTSKFGTLVDPTQNQRLHRTRLVFNALVGQQSNNSYKWLGSNQKLTRLKLYGGLESLLRLRISWEQFDTLWTKLDQRRSGDLDYNEFADCFGDLAEFESREGTLNISATNQTNSKSMQSLIRLLYELCDALRKADFTIVEMFSAFDRNGSGEVSIAEFCSLLKLMTGNHFEKRLIYQAMMILDTDGNKRITIDEVLRFVYRIWRTQLDDTAVKLREFDNGFQDNSPLIKKLLAERADIKEAIKKNYPRHWRDKLEQEGTGHHIPGPFQSLLERMEVGNNMVETDDPNNYDQPQARRGTKTLNVNIAAPTPENTMHSQYQLSGTDPAPNLSPSGKYQSHLNQQHQQNNRAAYASKEFLHSPTRPSSSPSKRANTAGHNSMLRFKVKLPTTYGPQRENAQLGVPPVKDFNRTNVFGGEVTKKVLRDNEDLFA